ncbi:MAG: hypothetical protein IT514_15470 [Burkholderiales bacterium]|nr:hypothetical protein [Burkholderiales bacterium]
MIDQAAAERAMSQAAAFASQRMTAAQEALGTLCLRGVDEPYSGVTQGPETIDESLDREQRYSVALMDFCRGLGAEVVITAPPAVESVVAAPTIGGSVPGTDPTQSPWASAPAETFLVMAQTPTAAADPTAMQVESMYEACAETLRALLATAIEGAKADCEGGERVRVIFRAAPDFASQVRLSESVHRAMGRIRCTVVCSDAPQASYLLGSVEGQPRPYQVAYELPDMTLFYGLNRLRWRDRRSPDADCLIQMVGGVA